MRKSTTALRRFQPPEHVRSSHDMIKRLTVLAAVGVAPPHPRSPAPAGAQDRPARRAWQRSTRTCATFTATCTRRHDETFPFISPAISRARTITSSPTRTRSSSPAASRWSPSSSRRSTRTSSRRRDGVTSIDVTLVSDDGTIDALPAVPRKQGTSTTSTPRSTTGPRRSTAMRWNYVNGGYAEMTNHYRTVGRQRRDQIADRPRDRARYHADVTSTFDGLQDQSADLSDDTVFAVTTIDLIAPLTDGLPPADLPICASR